MAGEPEEAEAALGLARQWLAAQGWEQQEGRTYHLALSELQSCPPGFRCVDVSCTAFAPEDGADEEPGWNGHAELLRRSRMLEVDLGTGRVDGVLAARDPKELKQILALERVQQQSARMEQELEDKIRLRAEAAKAEAAEDEAQAAAEAAAAQQPLESAAPIAEARAAAHDAQEAEERRRADEEFERQVQAEIERALKDPEAYASEQAAIEAAAAAQLEARQAGTLDSEPAVSPSAGPGLAVRAALTPALPAGKAATAHGACEANDVAALRELLGPMDGSANECRDSQDRRGWTPLHIAASSGSTECVEELLVRGAKCAATDKDGQTVLHRAVRHPFIIAALLQRGQDASKALVALDKRGCSALQLAAAAGADKSCALFCEAAAAGDTKAQALPGKPDKRGQTPLMVGCNAGNLAVATALLAVGAMAKVEHLDGNSVSALLLAARRGDSPQLCELLLAHGAQIWTRSKAGTTAVAEAAASPGGEETVALLMQNAIASTGLDALPLRDVATAVHAAASKGHHKAIARLVEPYQALPPPVETAKKAVPPLPKLLLSKFGKVKEVALQAAARAGHVNAVRLILEVAAGYEPRLLNKCIEASTSSGDSALVLAVRAGSLECAQALRGAGAAVTLSAVRAAAESDDSSAGSPAPLLTELLSGLDEPTVLSSCLALPPVDTNNAAAPDETPLAAASRVGKVDNVALLLQKAAQVLPEGVCMPGLGFSDALRAAVRFNHVQTLQALLKGGAPKASVLEPDSDGWSLLHVAAFHGGVDIMTVLLDHGDDERRWIDVDWTGANGVTALMRSTCHGAVAATQLLLERGAKRSRVDCEGRGPLHHAATTGVVPNDSAALLLKPANGEAALCVESTDVKGCTPLLLAIAHGHIEFAELLLDQHCASTEGSIVETEDGRPPPLPALHLAAATHQVDMVALLLKYGAAPTATNTQGETALFGACEATDEFEGPSPLVLDTVLFLLQKADGLTVATQANDGTTVLHRVAAASARALEPSEAQPEEEVVSPAAGAWLALLALLVKYSFERVGERGGETPAMLVRDRNGDSAVHLLACCKCDASAKAAITALKDGVGDAAWDDTVVVSIREAEDEPVLERLTCLGFI